jgi:hypothetical protein
MATMKKVNMPHQHKPDIHSAAPPWRMRWKTPRPFAAGAFALVLFEVALAHAHRLGRDFHQLVVLDEFDAVLQRQLDRRGDLDGVFLAADAEVGQLLGAGGVHHQIVVAAVDADDHAFVHRHRPLSRTCGPGRPACPGRR